MASESWTDDENDLIVADYFSMLADDLAGRPYNKAEHNRRLQTRISRSRTSSPSMPKAWFRSSRPATSNLRAMCNGAGFDIASFLPDGRDRLIEVKTTNGWERTPFLISRNELAVADERRSEWSLVRLWNFSREPKAFELYPPLDRHVSLTATSFQASFQ
jgi:hypothetical protein